MARRRKTGIAEDLTDLIARLPWWAGIALAVLSYFALHAVATSPMPTAKTPQEIGQLAATGIWRGLAYGGQYVLPFICIMGALISAIRRRERSKLVDTVAQSKAADALEAMSWKEFELLVGEGYRRQGYTVTENGGGGGDGGVDLVLTKANEKFFVQCKQWKAFKVGVSVVRELYGAMAASGAAGGFVVTSGRFTDEAIAFAQGRNIQLLDGDSLLRLIRKGQANVLAAEPTQIHRRSEAPVSPVGTTPTCPVCHQRMTRRVAKRGASAGSAFWGCSTYPKCKGTLPV